MRFIAWLCLLFLVHVCYGQSSSDSNRATEVRGCIQIGGYCQYHQDCCSNNCLTFSYKCVKQRSEEDQQHQIIVSSIPETNAINVNNVQELVDRFGGDNNNNEPANTQGPPSQSNPNAFIPCSGDNSNIPNTANSNCYENGRSCLNSRQCCSGECSKITNMCIVTLGIAPPPQSAAPEPTPCYGIGHKCYSPQECCLPLRCHGYYHHCVT